MSKTVNATINEETQIIEITGLIESTIEIGYEDDVDFTDLISHLTKMIDTAEVITLEVEEVEETKEKLVIITNTLKSVFEKYTESLSITLEEDEDLPFP
jgi:hypothetical protein